MEIPVPIPNAETAPTDRPRRHKVFLVNDRSTPRGFVIMVLKAEFGIGEDHARDVTLTAQRRGICLVAAYPRDVAETKAARASGVGRKLGYPLLFATEPEA